ncbi:hypothetical protein ACTZ8G_002671 [Listeria monocytogenes]|uniref:hypothetical protein n=1 Tax=Listeria monocytogenes TaxID=1639 RepID=UPI000874CA75|nr:hypothetical protein [Listeria monocytogenes]ECH7281624.1 hypothetical protein [Listeria monocytogenes]EKZ1003362.1 hypothetical protein [Listeria monocytogenes]EKZ1009027.1 hypothetical protein [Listeria monocytogenes]EKZ1698154.1 hypothetical protein [Listeria monocytogenes]MCJ38774.1 hypothetical protein [Listeria monocytogenes]
MSKKLVSIIFLGMLLLLAGCGKAVVDSKYTGKWKLESVSIGASDGTDMKDTDESNMMSHALEMNAAGDVKELYIYDEFVLTNSYKIKQKNGNEYQYDGPVTSKKVYGYETESEKENVQKALKALEAQDVIKIMKSEQKGNEYHLDTKAEREYEFSMELENENLILKKVDKKENAMVKETYKKN